jgi:hypothetical protein
MATASEGVKSLRQGVLQAADDADVYLHPPELLEGFEPPPAGDQLPVRRDDDRME